MGVCVETNMELTQERFNEMLTAAFRTGGLELVVGVETSLGKTNINVRVMVSIRDNNAAEKGQDPWIAHGSGSDYSSYDEY